MITDVRIACRFIRSFPAIVRLSTRLCLWSPGGSTLEERAAAMPGGTEELNRILECIHLGPETVAALERLKRQCRELGSPELYDRLHKALRAANGL